MIEYAEIAGDILTRLRLKNPRVHCITNFAAMNLTANMVLAIGATPSLTYSRDEVGDFVKSADSLLINLGTLDDARREAIPLALEACQKPWVLDPVYVNRAPQRLRFANEIMAFNPTLLRGNGDEIASFPQYKGLIAKTGAIDHVKMGDIEAFIHNGNPLMSKITAFGCAGTAVMAAALAVETDPFKATVSALLWLGVAADLVEATAPASFQVEFLDRLYTLTPREILDNAKVI